MHPFFAPIPMFSEDKGCIGNKWAKVVIVTYKVKLLTVLIVIFICTFFISFILVWLNSAATKKSLLEFM